MFSCCALFSQTEDPADVEHLKALDVSGAGETGLLVVVAPAGGATSLSF